MQDDRVETKNLIDRQEGTVVIILGIAEQSVENLVF